MKKGVLESVKFCNKFQLCKILKKNCGKLPVKTSTKLWSYDSTLAPTLSGRRNYQ